MSGFYIFLLTGIQQQNHSYLSCVLIIFFTYSKKMRFFHNNNNVIIKTGKQNTVHHTVRQRTAVERLTQYKLRVPTSPSKKMTF